MRRTTALIPLLLLTSAASAQTVPAQWHRATEWTDPAIAPPGSTLGNPAPDTEANLVWHYEWLPIACCPGPAWAQWNGANAMVSDHDFWGGSPAWAASEDGGAAIFSSSLLDAYFLAPTGNQSFKQKPFVRWENTTNESFEVDVVGTLTVRWLGPPDSVFPTTVNVAIVHLDASAGNAKTPLYLSTVDKPTPGSLQQEDLLLPPVSALGVPIDPGDSLLVSLEALNATGNSNFVYLVDSDLLYLVDDGVPATETVRLGAPPNPNALLPGVSSGPVMGATWDPVIDHTAFMPGAVLDLLLVSTSGTNVPLPPLGTLLCDLAPPTVLVVEPAGTPLAIPVPTTSAIAGATLCSQGWSSDGSITQLTNALDITIGTH